MSTPPPPVSALPGAADPSMEDILASIRRILNEDEAAAATGSGLVEPPPLEPEEEDVLVLDNSMMIGTLAEEPLAPMMAPDLAPAETMSRPGLLAPESEAAAAASVGTLLRTLTAERTTEVHRGGPTLEDMVREGIRPLLKSWLDVHLPPLVERLVRSEIERVSGRASL